MILIPKKYLFWEQLDKKYKQKIKGEGSQGMERIHQDKRSEKLFRVCKFLQTLYQELQLYSKISQQTQEQEEMEIGTRT